MLINALIMTVTLYSAVLEAARQLPLNDQVELADALLRGLRSKLWGEPAEPAAGELAPLVGMSAEELQVLAEAVLAPGHQQQLQALLDRTHPTRLGSYPCGGARIYDVSKGNWYTGRQGSIIN